MTLIEVVVAFAIIAVISVVIVIGFRTMGGVLQSGSEMDRIDQELEDKIAKSGAPTSSTGAILEFEVSGTAFTIPGSVNEYETDEDGTAQKFKVFSTK